MKRVKAACICQTLHFLLKNKPGEVFKDSNIGSDYARRLVKEEVDRYKNSLDRNRTKYKIISEETQPDGSVVIKIIKQYVSHPVGDYLD